MLSLRSTVPGCIHSCSVRTQTCTLALMTLIFDIAAAAMHQHISAAYTLQSTASKNWR